MRKLLFLIFLLVLAGIAVADDYARRYPSNTPLKVMGLVSAPAMPNTACTAGQMAYDSNYVYVCTSTNTWGRATIAEWLITRDLMQIEGVQMQIDGEDLQL